MDMGTIRCEDGYRVYFESVDAFETKKECLEFGKEIFRKINDVDNEEPLDVEITLDDEGFMIMHVNATFDEIF